MSIKRQIKGPAVTCPTCFGSKRFRHPERKGEILTCTRCHGIGEVARPGKATYKKGNP